MAASRAYFYGRTLSLKGRRVRIFLRARGFEISVGRGEQSKFQAALRCKCPTEISNPASPGQKVRNFGRAWRTTEQFEKSVFSKNDFQESRSCRTERETKLSSAHPVPQNRNSLCGCFSKLQTLAALGDFLMIVARWGWTWMKLHVASRTHRYGASYAHHESRRSAHYTFHRPASPTIIMSSMRCHLNNLTFV